MKRFPLIGFSILSGILLAAAWPVSPLTFLIFFAFVPLLFIADKTTKRKQFFLYAFIALLIWNALTTWWIWNSSAAGAIGAIIPNALLMCIPWLGYYKFKQKFGKRIGYFSLIAFWMLFEYIHLNWQLTWPWLSLGNVFAAQINWVQWYEFTGIGGGSLWVLVVNVLVFESIQRARFRLANRGGTIKMNDMNAMACFILILLPIIFSSLVTVHKKKPSINSSVVIVQPNIDPYQKFESNSTAEQLQILISLSEQKIDTTTKLVMWPETALSTNVPINEVATANIYQPVFEFVNRHPNITLLTGVETYKIVQEKTATSRKMQDGQFFESYNAAVSIKANQPLQFYIKSKLVPGVESLPTFLNFLGSIFEKFGGTTGGYARDTASIAFKNESNPFVTAPVICYESIYGEYVSTYVAKGANIITIITNDGWWGNTAGHKQHLQYAKLRAIETRRWVARSANTGISAVIDDYGNIMQQTKWDEATAFKYSIPTKTYQTFYVKHGDYLYKIFSVFALLMIGWNLFLWGKKKLLPQKH